jgi:hypothetical protein
VEVLPDAEVVVHIVVAAGEQLGSLLPRLPFAPDVGQCMVLRRLRRKLS